MKPHPDKHESPEDSVPVPAKTPPSSDEPEGDGPPAATGAKQDPLPQTGHDI
jgi:hypothetical protein